MRSSTDRSLRQTYMLGNCDLNREVSSLSWNLPHKLAFVTLINRNGDLE